jgi:alpha-tubulin suppressor-like RCC1 family protein
MGVNWRRTGLAAIKISLCTMMIGLGFVMDDPNKTVVAESNFDNLIVPAVAANGAHSMSLSADGTFSVWGNNEFKQLGIAGPVNRMHIPKKLNLGTVSSIATGPFHSAVVSTNGELWEFGGNQGGQLGRERNYSYSLPVRVDGLDSVKAAAAGMDYSLALTKTGEVWELGHNPYDFTGHHSSGVYVQRVSGLPENVESISAGEYSSFAIADGDLYAWGQNLDGELGDGTNTMRHEPVKVPISDVKQVAASNRHTVVLKHDGTVWVWGSNLCGQFGSNTITSSNSPVQVSGLSGITSIASGDCHNLALGVDGKVHAWGRYPFGNMSGEVVPGSPASLVPLDGVIAIAAGFEHSLAMTSDGTVWGWGDSTYGQVGDGRTIKQEQPIRVDTGAPDVPTNLKTHSSSGKVKLTWTTKDTDIQYYRLYWRQVGNDPFFNMAWVNEGTSFEVEGLNNLNRYEFKIEAVDWAGQKSQESAPVFAMPGVVTKQLQFRD